LVVLFCENLPIDYVLQLTARIASLLYLLYVEYYDKCYENCRLFENWFVILLV
jgi:hypothetical protein